MYDTKNLTISCSMNLVSSAFEITVPLPPSRALARTPQLAQLLFASIMKKKDGKEGRQRGVRAIIVIKTAVVLNKVVAVLNIILK